MHLPHTPLPDPPNQPFHHLNLSNPFSCQAQRDASRAMELELVDALTGALIEEPVRAADGHVYDRRALTAFFEQRRAAGQPIVSPQDLETPMGTELRPAPEVKKALDELRADAQHGAPAREPPQSFKSLSALRSVFDVLDPLSELLAETLNGRARATEQLEQAP